MEDGTSPQQYPPPANSSHAQYPSLKRIAGARPSPLVALKLRVVWQTAMKRERQAGLEVFQDSACFIGQGVESMIEKNQAEQQISRGRRDGGQPQVQQGSPALERQPQQDRPEQVWQHTQSGRGHAVLPSR